MQKLHFILHIIIDSIKDLEKTSGFGYLFSNIVTFLSELNINISVLTQSNITLLVDISDKEKSMYLSKSKALVFPGIEDFGIAPLESMASGTPVIAYKKGGVLDYLEDGFNGIFFNEQSSKSLINSIKKFENEKNTFDPNKIRKSVLNFTFDNFLSYN